MSTNDKQVQDILKAHGLDFTIEKIPMTGTRANGDIVITPYFGLYNSKSGETINTAKAGYTISQNAELVDMILQGTAKFTKDLTVKKAGSIHGGRRVYMQMEIAGMSNVGVSRLKRYVTIIDSNDGSTSLSVGIGDLDMTCENQFFKFYKKGQAKFRHTATITEKIKKIPELIELALAQSLKQIEIYRAFQSTAVSQKLAHELVKNLLGYDRVLTSAEDQAKLKPRSIAIMDSLYKHIDKETKEKGMTLWGLHSGVTSWTTHEKKGPKRENGVRDSAESMLVGIGYKKNLQSFQFAAKKAKLLVEL